MTVTEFNSDPIFDAAAAHWPEREPGWQGRLSDLLDAVRSTVEDEVLTDAAADDDEIDEIANRIRREVANGVEDAVRDQLSRYVVRRLRTVSA